jgi:hypothetical protein
MDLRGNSGGDEELRAIGIFARVCHTKNTLLGMLQLEVFIGEFIAVDRFTASSISTGEITTLDHEVLDDSVER